MIGIYVSVCFRKDLGERVNRGGSRMFYTLISGLALILNLIVNRGACQNVKVQEGMPMERQLPRIRYSVFVIVSSCYFFVDAAWGLFDTFHENNVAYHLLYVDTLLFFLFMILTMITWIRYIVAYIGKQGRRSDVLLYVVTGLFFVALISLLINFFYPFIFYFDEHHGYVPLPGRHILLIVQIALYLVTAVYMLFVAVRSYGEQKVRYYAVGSACVALEIFLILQVLSVWHPFYAMGLIIAICLVHSFIEMSERKEKRIYDSIARGLAEDYAAMYYINIETGEYQEYITSQQYRDMNIPVSGKDFYGESTANVEQFVYPEDLNVARGLYTKEVMKQQLEGRTTYSYKYRIMVEGEPHFYLFTLKLSNDGKHFVLYEKDIEADIRAEKEHMKALHAEKELARRDELTGVKNKNAYKELECSVQENIDNGLDYLTFALIVCDANNLKKINDTEGHVAGDEYIKSSAKMLCDIFVHSPVFRVGGDEFVVFLRSNDFTNREVLTKKLHDQVEENLKSGQRPILASGMADYLPGVDSTVAEIFERADKAMYENKQKLKEEERSLAG